TARTDHQTGRYRGPTQKRQLVAMVTDRVTHVLARRLAGGALTRWREQIGNGADRGRDEAVERPDPPLLPLEQPGLRKNPEVVAHSGLRKPQRRGEVTHARLAIR